MAPMSGQSDPYFVAYLIIELLSCLFLLFSVFAPRLAPNWLVIVVGVLAIAVAPILWRILDATALGANGIAEAGYLLFMIPTVFINPVIFIIALVRNFKG